MADDALSKAETEARGELGWGGARQRRWHQAGKRAVVLVDPAVYSIVTALADACHRTNRDLNSQIYAAGMEALTGRSIEDLRLKTFAMLPGQGPSGQRAFTHEEVRERFGLFKEVTLVTEEPVDPDFQ